MIGALALTIGGELALQAHDDRVQRQAEDAVLVTVWRGEAVFADTWGFEARPPVERAVEFGCEDAGDDEANERGEMRQLRVRHPCGVQDCGELSPERVFGLDEVRPVGRTSSP